MNEGQILFLDSEVFRDLRDRKKRQSMWNEFTNEDRLFSIGDKTVRVDPEHTASNINDFDISVISTGSYWHDDADPHASYSKNCIRRKQEILTSLKEGKTIVLLVEKMDDLLVLLMNSLKIEVKSIQNYTDDVDTIVMKFNDFVDRYCNAVVGFSSSSINPICSFKNQICGFFQNVGTGTLYVMPVVMKNTHEGFFVPMLADFFKNLSSIEKEVKLPSYLDDQKILDENDLIELKRKNLLNIEKIDLQLDKYNNVKSILFLKHDILVDNIIVTLADIGVETHKLEKYEEDFWILKNNQKVVILEVKGTNKNFTRKFINDLDNHRSENQLPEDFPSLLVVNTFAEATSFAEKNVEPETDTLKRAKAQKIMVMRTLDLFNLYVLVKSGKLQIDSFEKLLMSNNCGWIKIDEKMELIIDE